MKGKRNECSVNNHILAVRSGAVVPGFSVSVMLNVSLISCDTPSTLSVKKTDTNGELASGRMRLLDTVTSLPTSAQHKHNTLSM